MPKKKPNPIKESVNLEELLAKVDPSHAARKIWAKLIGITSKKVKLERENCLDEIIPLNYVASKLLHALPAAIKDPVAREIIVNGVLPINELMIAASKDGSLTFDKLHLYFRGKNFALIQYVKYLEDCE